MRRVLITICLLQAVCFPVTADPVDATGFDSDFVDATLRVDLFHGGNSTAEWASFDRAWRQGRWAGSRTHLLDEPGIGRYLVTVSDTATGRLLFAWGYDSLFGEYRTTSDAAAGVVADLPARQFWFRFPAGPAPPARRSAHAATNRIELLLTTLDPGATTISLEPPPDRLEVVDQHVTGEPAIRLDLAVVGEGYRADQDAAFRTDLAHFSEVLLGAEPYAAFADRINIRGVLRPSEDSGVDEPSRGRWRRTAVGASFDSLGSERYLLTEDNRALREIAATVPYDVLVIMVNQSRYGGGGIYNTYATFTSGNQWSEYVLIHELGHAFGGLADEYYTSSVAYNDFYPRGVEPVEPNITALLDPANLKWRDLVTRGTPVPTPWEKSEFDSMDLAYQRRRGELNDRIAVASRTGAPIERITELEDEGERLSLDHARRVDAFLAASTGAGKVGAFEGAGYSSEGLYRPAVDCIMFSKGNKPFCPVCRGALEQAIRRLIE